jgi:hypothetical protein
MEDVAPPAGFNPLAPALVGHYASNYTVVAGVENPATSVSADIDSGVVVGFPTVEGLTGNDLIKYLISKVNFVDAGFVVDGLNPEPLKQYVLDTTGYLALTMLQPLYGALSCTWVGQLPEEPGGIVRHLVQLSNYQALENKIAQIKASLHLLPVNSAPVESNAF